MTTIESASEDCEEEAVCWVNEDNEPYCTAHGIEKAEFYETNTVPIITLKEYEMLTDDDLEFFDIDTVILQENGQESPGVLTLEDVGRVSNLIKGEGITVFREPIIMARCLFCEAVAIGHLNLVGGWLARHTHFHQYYAPEDDYAGVTP